MTTQAAPSLDSQMTTILLHLELLSTGHVQSWNSSGSPSGEPDDRMVSEVARQARLHLLDRPPWLVFRARYEGCRRDSQRQQVIDEAQAELDGWRKRTAPMPEGVKSLSDLILEDGEGHDAEAVAIRFGVAVAFVHRLRSRGGRGVEDGLRVVGAVELEEISPENAAVLSRRGMTQVEIARRMGVSQPSVHRLLRDAKFGR